MKGLKQFFSRLFCTHIYHRTKEEHIGSYEGVYFCDTGAYDIYKEYKTCIKCGKEVVVKVDHRKRLIWD